MCACMHYECIHLDLYVARHTRVCMCMHEWMRVHMYIYMHAHMHAYMYQVYSPVTVYMHNAAEQI